MSNYYIDELTGLPRRKDEPRWYCVYIGRTGLGIYPSKARAKAMIKWKWSKIYPDENIEIT